MTRIELAATNNAYLYEAVCTAHGCETDFSDFLMLCKGTPPRFYAQAVTLMEGAAESVRARVTGGFKDSFHDVEPGEDYALLFEASWIWQDAGTPGETALTWTRASTDAELQVWEDGWATGDLEAADFPRQFPASLLDRTDFAFFSAWHDGFCVGGTALNCSPGVVGVSNVYSGGDHGVEIYGDLARLAADAFPGRPLVGYERDASLAAAVDAGFEAIGPLRVWVRRTD